MEADRHHTYLLKNGMIVDGTGRESFRGDVVVCGDKIVGVWRELERPDAAELTRRFGSDELVVMDVSGKVVAPGFIDAHTHDDSLLLRSPDMLPKVSQGVTTVIVGNCGISLAPFTRTTDPPAPLTLLGGKSDYKYNKFADFAKALREIQPNTNVAALVGHTTLRVNHMDDLYRPATEDEVAQMQEQLIEGLENGAIGFSTGLEYPEALQSKPEEIDSLLKTVKRYRGVYTTHIRYQGDKVVMGTQEALESAKKANVPLVLFHHLCDSPPSWGKKVDTLALVGEASDSQMVVMDRYPYAASSTILYTHLALVEGVKVIVTWSDAHPECQGKYLHQIARDWNRSLPEACDRLQPAGAIYFNVSENVVQRVLKHPLTMIGSDGLPLDKHPHPRLWGTFPRVLSHYTRHLNLFSLTEAIRKMTSLPTKVFGLQGRGSLKEGYFADVVVFDAGSVQDKATFENPTQQSVGIELVMINGNVAFQNGQLTGARAGRLLERQAE